MNTAVKDADTPDGRATRWDEHRLQRRAELIRAARHAVHDLGPQASMGDIATHAGTSKSVFYRYFGDKNGLQAAVGERAIDFMERELLAAAETSDNALEGLYAMVSVYLRLAESSPHVYAFSTRLPPETSEATEGSGPSGPSGGPGGPSATGGQPAAMADFFERIAAVMDVHFRDYLRQQGRRPSAASATWYWPRAAIGMVRSAGESWLSTPSGADRPDAGRLARKITAWLTVGLSGTYAAVDLPDPPDHRVQPVRATSTEPPTPEQEQS
ncbi:TetR/AcrR family transcriptional regulator [Citricoccus sp. K5]|uniref:TetR/AcrR family transcriptional regulator n=1 Tax=Citricoccus sp. K5 TaxID=2653135 RepID=UPI0012F0595D|nr:TetR/AcrR family transcriptional regulator [Citricoccus sp. K5]VXB36456.1 TetR family transcriptional regulator [Citricoccus sp. K5]